MPQYDAFGNLKRMAFIYGGTTLTLLVNPQNYQYQEPQRATNIKTQSDNVIEMYGPDFPVISITGNTGYRKARDQDTGQYLTGKGRFDRIRNFFLGYMGEQVDGMAQNGSMYFYNWTDDLSYTVTVPSGGFQYSRSVDTTLLYNYSISLLVLSGANQPNRTNIVNPIIGSGTGTSVSDGISISEQNAKDNSGIMNVKVAGAASSPAASSGKKKKKKTVSKGKKGNNGNPGNPGKKGNSGKKGKSGKKGNSGDSGDSGDSGSSGLSGKMKKTTGLW